MGIFYMGNFNWRGVRLPTINFQFFMPIVSAALLPYAVKISALLPENCGKYRQPIS